MRVNTWIVPIGSFLLAVLLSVASLPSSQPVRAAEEATGGGTPPCSVWEMKKISVKVKKWQIRVTELRSEMRNNEPVAGSEATHTTVKAEIRAHNRLDPTTRYDELPGSYIVVIEGENRSRPKGTFQVPLHVQSVQQHEIKDQILTQFSASRFDLDLLGNPVPVPPGDVVIDSFTLIDQELTVEASGYVFCEKSRIFGVFIPRSVTFAVAGGSGSGTN